MKMRLILVLVLVSLLIIIAACGPASTPEPTPTPTEVVHAGKAITETRCIGCHDLNRISNARFDETGWKLTIDRMVMNGAQLNEEQQALVIDYLAQEFPKE